MFHNLLTGARTHKETHVPESMLFSESTSHRLGLVLLATGAFPDPLSVKVAVPVMEMAGRRGRSPRLHCVGSVGCLVAIILQFKRGSGTHWLDHCLGRAHWLA